MFKEIIYLKFVCNWQQSLITTHLVFLLYSVTNLGFNDCYRFSEWLLVVVAPNRICWNPKRWSLSYWMTKILSKSVSFHFLIPLNSFRSVTVDFTNQHSCFTCPYRSAKTTRTTSSSRGKAERCQRVGAKTKAKNQRGFFICRWRGCGM